MTTAIKWLIGNNEIGAKVEVTTDDDDAMCRYLQYARYPIPVNPPELSGCFYGWDATPEVNANSDIIRVSARGYKVGE